MLLTISATGQHADELGFLLHKHPARLQSFAQSYGPAHVFYPVSDAQRCTVALLVEVDPIGMVRNRRGGGESGLMAQYVNDRPYVASSLLSVALGEGFSLGAERPVRGAPAPGRAAPRYRAARACFALPRW